jgi:transcriptional/translational regulatory protein YebC/TACO1
VFPDSPPPAGSELVRYEGYGPGGAAVLVDCVTADRARTAEQLRSAFVCHGGDLGAPEAVSYLFNKVGVLAYRPGTDAEPLLARAALEAGAEEVVAGGDRLEVLTDPIDLDAVRGRLAAQGWVPVAADVTERAWDAVPLSGEDARRMAHLLAALERLDHVRNVYSNVAIPEEIVAEL